MFWNAWGFSKKFNLTIFIKKVHITSENPHKMEMFLSLQIGWILGQMYIQGLAHKSVYFCTITNRKAVKNIMEL